MNGEQVAAEVLNDMLQRLANDDPMAQRQALMILMQAASDIDTRLTALEKAAASEVPCGELTMPPGSPAI